MNDIERVVSYAQNREDIILSAFFMGQKSGFYVDVGAGDPVDLSVTKYFYDRGWRGINIEPNEVLHEKLQKYRPEDINLNVGAAARRGTLPFRLYEADGLSTFSELTKRELAEQATNSTGKYKDIDVHVLRLQDIFKEQSVKQIDFLKIDVEGYESDVLEGNDWEKYRPKVLCIEANHIHENWASLLSGNNYKKVFHDGLNDYYVDSLDGGITFNYLDAAVGREVVAYGVQYELAELTRLNSLLDDDLKTFRNVNREKDDEIAILNQYIIEKSRLKTLLKDLIIKIDSIITLRLTKKIHSKKRYPFITLDANTNNAEELLVAIQEGDKRVFTKKPGPMERLEFLFYWNTYRLYCACRKLIYRPIKLLKHRLIREKVEG